MYTGRLFEIDVLGECNWREEEYVPFWKCVRIVKHHQPSRLGPDGERLQQMVSQILGSPVRFYTAIGSPLDHYHGVDGFFEHGRAVVTIDLTTNPNKLEYKADIVLFPEDFDDPERFQEVAERIAGLLTSRSSTSRVRATSSRSRSPRVLKWEVELAL